MPVPTHTVPPEFLQAHMTTADLALFTGCSERSARRYMQEGLPADLTAKLANAIPDRSLGKALAECLLPDFEAFPTYEPTDDELDQDGDGDVDVDDARIASRRRLGVNLRNEARFEERIQGGVLDQRKLLDTVKEQGEADRWSRLCAAINKAIVSPGRRKLSGLPQSRNRHNGGGA